MSARDDAAELLGAFDLFSPTPADTRMPMLATVSTVPTSGHVTVLFDGENVTGGQVYPCLKSYTGTVGDRVVVLPVGSRTSWVVLGAVTP